MAATTRPMTLSIPNQIAAFLETKPNKSAYVANLIEHDKEYRAWKGQA